MWGASPAITRPRITCARCANARRHDGPWKTECLTLLLACLGAQDFTNFAIDARRVFGGLINQTHPAAVHIIELRLRKKIGSLHHGLDGIAQVMRESAQSRHHVFFELLLGWRSYQLRLWAHLGLWRHEGLRSCRRTWPTSFDSFSAKTVANCHIEHYPPASVPRKSAITKVVIRRQLS